MKALSITMASFLMGIILVITGYGKSFVDTEIELETENEFVVEFYDETVNASDAVVATVESMANATCKARPYEGFFVFTVENGSYEQLVQICSSIEELPEVKGAHTKWSK